jgi:hypothetical protein
VITGRTLATLTGLMNDVLTPGAAGMDATVGGVASASGATEEASAGGVLAAGVLDADLLDADLLGDGVGALTCTVPAAVGIVAMAGLMAASAVAVRVTEVTDVVPEATGTCACIW